MFVTSRIYRLNLLTDDCQPHETVRTERRMKDEGGRGETNMEKTTEAQGQICMFRVKHGQGILIPEAQHQFEETVQPKMKIRSSFIHPSCHFKPIRLFLQEIKHVALLASIQ